MAKEKESTPKKLSPFDFINNINGGTAAGNLLEGCTADDSESTSIDNPSKQYVPFIINRGLSYFNDTILFANEMNKHHSLPPKMQYDFYRHAMRPRKRFSKWSKKIDDSADVLILQQHYGYNATLAREAHSLLTANQMSIIRKTYDKGGTSKKPV